MKCSKCKFDIPDNLNYCPICGNKLNDSFNFVINSSADDSNNSSEADITTTDESASNISTPNEVAASNSDPSIPYTPPTPTKGETNTTFIEEEDDEDDDDEFFFSDTYKTNKKFGDLSLDSIKDNIEEFLPKVKKFIINHKIKCIIALAIIVVLIGGLQFMRHTQAAPLANNDIIPLIQNQTISTDRGEFNLANASISDLQVADRTTLSQKSDTFNATFTLKYDQVNIKVSANTILTYNKSSKAWQFASFEGPAKVVELIPTISAEDSFKQLIKDGTFTYGYSNPINFVGELFSAPQNIEITDTDNPTIKTCHADFVLDNDIFSQTIGLTVDLTFDLNTKAWTPSITELADENIQFGDIVISNSITDKKFKEFFKNSFSEDLEFTKNLNPNSLFGFTIQYSTTIDDIDNLQLTNVYKSEDNNDLWIAEFEGTSSKGIIKKIVLKGSFNISNFISNIRYISGSATVGNIEYADVELTQIRKDIVGQSIPNSIEQFNQAQADKFTLKETVTGDEAYVKYVNGTISVNNTPMKIQLKYTADFENNTYIWKLTDICTSDSANYYTP